MVKEKRRPLRGRRFVALFTEVIYKSIEPLLTAE
jgi:hypothetical protein